MKSRRLLQKWLEPVMRYVVVLFVRDILYYVFANLEEESFCIVTLTQTRNTLTNRLQTNMLFGWKANFLTFPACFWIPIFFSYSNSNCSDLLYLRNLQEQVKKAFCYQKLFWPFTVWKNRSSDLKLFAFSASNFKFFSITRIFFFSK